MIAVHQVTAQVFVTLRGEEVQHHLLLLQGLLSPCQLDAAVGAVLEGVEGTVKIQRLGCHWAINGLVDGVPIDVLVVLEDLDLYCLLSDLVLDSFLLELLEDAPDCLLQAGGDIEQIDLPSDLFDHGQLLLQPGDGLHVDLDLVDGAIVDPDHSILLQCVEDPAEQLAADLMLPAEGVDPDHLLLIFLGVLLADGIAIQQLILDVIGIEPFLGLLLPPDGLLHHLHDDLLQVVVGHQVGSDAVAVVVVVVLLEEQQLFLGREGGFHEFDHIGEGEIDSHIEVTKSEEVSVLGNGNIAVGDTLDQLEDLLLLLVPLQPRQHLLGNEAVHLPRAQVVEQVDRSARLEQQLLVEQIGLLPSVDQDEDSFELVLGEIAHHVLKFVLRGGTEHNEVELCSLGTVDLLHAVEGEVLAVVFGHEGVVEPENAVGVGLGDDAGDKGRLGVVEVHVTDKQKVALELMILLALEERRSNEQKLQFLQLVQLKHPHLVLRLLVRTQKAPPQLGQPPDLLHPGDPKGRILGHDDRSAFNLLMQYLDQPGRGIEGQVGQPAKLLTLLQPQANIADLLRDLHEGLLLRGGGFGVGAGAGVGVGVEAMLFEEMGEILVQTDLEQRFLEERSLDGLVMLEVNVIPNDVSKTRRTRVRVDVLLFLFHLKLNLK